MWEIALHELRRLGYSVFPKDGRIGYKFQGKRAPDPARLPPLFGTLISNKAEITEYLEKQDFEGIYRSALHDIDQQYLPGTIAYARRFLPGLWEEILEAEKRISEIWTAGSDFEDFKKAVGTWRMLMTKASGAFRENQKYGH
jgi:hypothetical protein